MSIPSPESAADERSWEYSNERFELIDTAKGTAAAECDQNTALPACQLMAYNVLKNPNISEKDGDILRQRIFITSQSEKRALEKRELVPTIGVELELPSSNISEIQMDTLNEFGINTERDEHQGAIYEIISDFSYSAEVQARILEECAKLGINKENIDAGIHTDTSLHVNLGIPNTLIGLESHQFTKSRSILVDSFTYAFTSPERIKRRKTPDSSNIKRASQFAGDSVLRLEIRTLEFADSTTFRMLGEIQALAAAFFACMKMSQNRSINPDIQAQTEALAGSWSNFEQEADYILEHYGLADAPVRFYDRIKDEASRFMENNPEMRNQFRILITKYAKEAKQIIKSKV